MNRMEQIDYVFETVSKKLPEAGVEFLMIGGHAVNYYGYTRATMDVDFMIAAQDVSKVRQVMKDAGFTNISEGETVIFFTLPDSTVRVDFLPVDSRTIAELLSNAVSVEYGGVSLTLPCLPDLLSMKLFALKSGNPRRTERDMTDIVQMVAENSLTTEVDLKPLCEKYATDRIYEELSARIREMTDV